VLKVNRPTNWVSLTGFMGVGKSRIGRDLAHELMLHFIDLDGYIERSTGLAISDIFVHMGQETFRRMEREALEEVSQKDYLVLSLGGGTFIDPINRARMLERGPVVALWASPDTIYERVTRKPGQRPILSDPNPKARIEALLAERTPIYQQAHIHVSTDGRRVPDVVSEIVQKLWTYANNPDRTAR
jgi:shikimate kinase